MIIKVLLIASVAAASWWLLSGRQRGNQLALTRIAGLGVAAAWVVAVLAPDLVVTRIAHLVGVGRGTDLVLYMLVVAFTFSTVANRSRVRDLEDQVATLARAHALLEERTGARDELPTDV